VSVCLSVCLSVCVREVVAKYNVKIQAQSDLLLSVCFVIFLNIYLSHINTPAYFLLYDSSLKIIPIRG
jgi:hypothetical protein